MSQRKSENVEKIRKIREEFEEIQEEYSRVIIHFISVAGVDGVPFIGASDPTTRKPKSMPTAEDFVKALKAHPEFQELFPGEDKFILCVLARLGYLRRQVQEILWGVYFCNSEDNVLVSYSYSAMSIKRDNAMRAFVSGITDIFENYFEAKEEAQKNKKKKSR